jgi:hypothetical protein
LKQSRDLLLTFDGQLCSLVKDRCEKENDAGIYRIAAVNSMGQAESICQVTIHSSQTPIFRERIQTVRSIPTLVQTLQDQTIAEGSRIFLQVQLNGQTSSNASWFKDGCPIKATDNHRVSSMNLTCDSLMTKVIHIEYIHVLFSMYRSHRIRIYSLLTYHEHRSTMQAYIK